MESPSTIQAIKANGEVQYSLPLFTKGRLFLIDGGGVGSSCDRGGSVSFMPPGGRVEIFNDGRVYDKGIATEDWA